jgi:hypothetical protein
VRNVNSTFYYAIQGLHAQFHVLLTATPVPWGIMGYGGLLALMQDLELNAQAKEQHQHRILENPYIATATTEDKKYACTHTAFVTFV